MARAPPVVPARRAFHGSPAKVRSATRDERNQCPAIGVHSPGMSRILIPPGTRPRLSCCCRKCHGSACAHDYIADASRISGIQPPPQQQVTGGAMWTFRSQFPPRHAWLKPGRPHHPSSWRLPGGASRGPAAPGSAGSAHDAHCAAGAAYRFHRARRIDRIGTVLTSAANASVARALPTASPVASASDGRPPERVLTCASPSDRITPASS
jgi:hypothetical protein